MGPGRVAVRLSPARIDPKTGRQSISLNGATSTDPEEIQSVLVTCLTLLER